jgi:cell division protein FtsB
VDDERDAPPPLDPTGDVPPASPARPATVITTGPEAPEPTDGVDLSVLSIGGITRRRAGWVAAILVAAWIVVIFAKQTGEASQAAQRAEQIAAENAALVAEVAALEEELQLIERPAYVQQQARGYQLGTPKEIPFSLAASVKAPGPNAPGSASGRLGAEAERTTPLESWLSLLFGPLD